MPEAMLTYYAPLRHVYSHNHHIHKTIIITLKVKPALSTSTERNTIRIVNFHAMNNTCKKYLGKKQADAIADEAVYKMMNDEDLGDGINLGYIQDIEEGLCQVDNDNARIRQSIKDTKQERYDTCIKSFDMMPPKA